MDNLFKKRTDLIIDYISQILVYGSNTSGNIVLSKNKFDDGKYLVLTVNVLKNSYFRWHDLGIIANDSLKFYQFVISKVLERFKSFNITFIDNHIIRIFSSVNNNQIDIQFTFTTQKEKEYFQKQEELFYNKEK